MSGTEISNWRLVPELVHSTLSWPEGVAANHPVCTCGGFSGRAVPLGDLPPSLNASAFLQLTPEAFATVTQHLNASKAAGPKKGGRRGKQTASEAGLDDPDSKRVAGWLAG